MKPLKHSIYLFFGLFFIACHSERSEKSQDHKALNPTKGDWILEFQLDDSTSLPVNFKLTEGLSMVIKNGEEAIQTKPLEIENDSTFTIDLPVFESAFRGKFNSNSSFTGNYLDYSKGEDYKIPFVGSVGNERFENSENNQGNFPKKWEVAFGEENDTWQALGIFEEKENKVIGTFLTETGDYRHLEGVLSKNTLKLSSFDGSHVFLFTADLKNDSLINGVFRSGNHYQTSWKAIANDGFELTNPDSLTFLKEGGDKIAFSFPDVNGDSVSLDDEQFKNKVVVVQVLGTWCPNCMDETQYYSELHEKYKSQGLEFIGLAFERHTDFEKASASVKKMVNDLGVGYPVLIAGRASKTEAAEKLPMLNHVLSFPTSIFIDRYGNVQKIHTGFYGKGTGEYFDTYTTKTDRFIQELLK